MLITLKRTSTSEASPLRRKVWGGDPLLAQHINLAFKLRVKFGEGINRAQLAQELEGLALEVLAQLSVVLLVHLASLKIKVKVTNCCVECFLLE